MPPDELMNKFNSYRKNHIGFITEIATLALVFSGVIGCTKVTLEEQFEGIINCKIENIFLDPVTENPSGTYFIERQLQPCHVDEAAFYCVDDTFHGLNVWQVAIPYRGPFSVHAIYFKENYSVAVNSLINELSLDMDNNETKPILIADPERQGRSIIYCEPYSE